MPSQSTSSLHPFRSHIQFNSLSAHSCPIDWWQFAKCQRQWTVIDRDDMITFNFQLLLLQNVERGSRVMTKYERQGLLECGIDGAIIEIRPSSNRNSTTMRIQKWCVIETIMISLRTEPHAQPLLTVGNPQSMWHHNIVIIRSGRRSVSNSKHCDSKNVFLLKRS